MFLLYYALAACISALTMIQLLKINPSEPYKGAEDFGSHAWSGVAFCAILPPIVLVGVVAALGDLLRGDLGIGKPLHKFLTRKVW